MKFPYRLRAALCLALIAGGAGCSRSAEKPAAATPAQDSMLLRDLAEANKNTAAAEAVDNSLSTVKTSGSGTVPTSNEVPGSSNTQVVPRPSPSGSQVLTSGPKRTPPLKANDAPGPTTVSTDQSPARGSGNPCDSPAPVDQRSCLNRSIVENDADLNQTYQELIAQSRKSGGPELEQRFREAQRNWVNQRDAECRDAGSGALWARERARCLANKS
ncbi:MAG TPA: lysozyme inhibitor LprI family protein, partial [Gemmatimonadaceae bacterium]|nr:lysozyme inhibitor LprI family protein [Gemmatimonadaceae bacterium]